MPEPPVQKGPDWWNPQALLDLCNKPLNQFPDAPVHGQS